MRLFRKNVAVRVAPGASFIGPTQAAADGYLESLWRVKAALRPQAIRAAARMRLWHENPRSDGSALPSDALGAAPNVVALPVRRHH